MKTICIKLFVVIFALIYTTSTEAQDMKEYFVAYEFIGETVYTNHTRWRFELYPSSIVVNDGKNRYQFNYSSSDSTGKWYKATISFNNSLIPASEESIWLSNDKKQMIWTKSGLFTISRLLCSSLEMAKRTAHLHGYQ